MKHIEFLQQESDLMVFLKYIKTLDVQIYTYNGKVVDFDNTVVDVFCNRIYYISSNHFIPQLSTHKGNTWIENSEQCIEVDTTIKTQKNLYIPGAIAIPTPAQATELFDVYKLIVKYIKSNYTLSDDKVFYVAPQMFNDWQEKKVSFHFFVQRVKFDVPVALLDNTLFCKFLDYNKYLWTKDGYESYIIYQHGAKLFSYGYIKNPNYFPESECVFVQKATSSHNPIIRFIADKRHFDNKDSNVERLFNDIKQYCSGLINKKE